MTTKPLSRPELEALLRDVGEAGFGKHTSIVAHALESALFYEERVAKYERAKPDLTDAVKWRTYMEQNREAQARYREKRRAAKLERRP